MTGARHERRAYDSLSAGETLRPLRDQIIVKVLPLALSDSLIADWKGNAVRGEIVAVGPGEHSNVHRRGKKDGRDYHTVSKSRWFKPTEVRVGQVVHLGGMELGGYLFPRIYIEGDECVIASEKDVAAVEV